MMPECSPSSVHCLNHARELDRSVHHLTREEQRTQVLAILQQLQHMQGAPGMP